MKNKCILTNIMNWNNMNGINDMDKIKELSITMKESRELLISYEDFMERIEESADSLYIKLSKFVDAGKLTFNSSLNSSLKSSYDILCQLYTAVHDSINQNEMYIREATFEDNYYIDIIDTDANCVVIEMDYM